MEAIAKLPGKLIPEVVGPTGDIFVPLLRARRSQIEQTPKKTFKYGPTDRHKVDVYYPPTGTSNAPILFFVYGGGFISGERTLVPGLHFENLGSFFAQRGILTCIADYRLAPETLYPGPVHDLRDAVEFILASPDVDVGGRGADKTNVYLLGHSAGGAHVATLFLNEDILRDETRKVLKGAILSSAAYENGPPASMYYGEPESEIDSKTPMGHFKSKSPDKLKQVLPPRLFLLISENDPPFLVGWGENFRKELRERGITDWEFYTMKGHNHISPNFVLNSGEVEGEEWGKKVAKWIKA